MNEIDMRGVFGDYLVELGKKFNNIVVLDCDLSSSTRTYKFGRIFPERFFNLGIAEQNMVGTALGFAISGKIPIVSGFSIFNTGRAWEFIRMACHDNLNIKVITTHGGIVGEDGSTHNALEDLSLMTVLPNLNVLVPTDNTELLQMVELALKTKGPFYIRLPRGKFPEIHNNDFKFRLGKPEVVKEGDDICLIGCGFGTHIALKYALKIEKELNISLKIINLSTIKPVDEQTLKNEIETIKGIVTIEEHNTYCGLGSILSRLISEINPKPMKFVGVENSFIQSGKREEILNFYGLNLKNIKNKIINLQEMF